MRNVEKRIDWIKTKEYWKSINMYETLGEQWSNMSFTKEMKKKYLIYYE